MLSQLRNLDKRRILIGIVLAAAAALVIVTFNSRPSHAGTSWTGCGVGVHGSLVRGTADFGGPIDISSSGQSAGVGIFCDYQMQSLVAGVALEANKMWGDLETLGVDYDVSIVGRLGVLPHQNALVYGLAQFTRFYTSGPDVDAWGLGGGIEVKIKGTPISLDLSYRHLWVEDIFGAGVELSGDIVRGGIKVKLGPDMQPSIFDDSSEPAPKKACDPKLGNCKVKP